MLKRLCIGAIVVFLCVSAIPLIKYRYLYRSPSRISRCPSAEIQPSSQVQEIRATRVVFKPWKGRHHVYGVFVVPPGYQPTNFFKISTENTGDYCGTIAGKPPETYGGIVIGQLRTRTALWLVAKGEQDRVAQPQNWTLEIVRESAQSDDSLRKAPGLAATPTDQVR